MLMNEVEFCQKVVVLLVRPATYWVDVYIYIYISNTDGVTVIIVGNGLGNSSLNPGHTVLMFLAKDMNSTILSPVMAK